MFWLCLPHRSIWCPVLVWAPVNLLVVGFNDMGVHIPASPGDSLRAGNADRMFETREIGSSAELPDIQMLALRVECPLVFEDDGSKAEESQKNTLPALSGLIETPV